MAASGWLERPGTSSDKKYEPLTFPVCSTNKRPATASASGCRSDADLISRSTFRYLAIGALPFAATATPFPAERRRRPATVACVFVFDILAGGIMAESGLIESPTKHR